MFDAWNAAGVGAGAVALSYLAAGRKVGGSDASSLRLSLDKGGSLIGDVRVLGGFLAWGASMYTGGSTKRALQVIALASGLSVLTTEALRWQLGRTGTRVQQGIGPVFPSFGALPGGQGQRSYAQQGAWARS